MLEEIGKVGQTGQEPGPGGEAPKEQTVGVPQEPLKCPYCERTFKDQRGLGPHLRFHQPKSPKVAKGTKVTGGEVKEPAADVIEQAINRAVEHQLTQLIPELKKGIEDNLTTTMVEAIRLMNEKITTEVNNLAVKAEAELQARFPGNGAGNLPAVQGGMGNMGGMSPILQALLARFMAPSGGSDGGGNFLEQASRIGQAIGAMMGPVAQMQSTAFANALKLIDLAQKFPTASPEEKAKVIGELAGSATGAPVPPTPPAPPAEGKAPGALGPGS